MKAILIRMGIQALAGFVAMLIWFALTIYPTRWFDLPWWGTLALALFWLWQMHLARTPYRRIVIRIERRLGGRAPA